MFWVGLAIAFLAGLSCIGLSRHSVKSRFPRVRDLHLDLVAVVFLCCGLLVSALVHLNSEKQITYLKEASQRVRSFEVNFDIQFTSNWSGASPQSPRVMVFGQSPVKIDIALKAGNVRTLELYMDKEPSFGPSEEGWVHTTFRVKAEPGSWIVGSDTRKLTEIRKLVFQCYGVRLQDSRDGIFTIGTNSRIFVNGRQAALIEFGPQKAVLSQLPLGDKNPEMSFDGHWVIQPE
jgi:hypothetical protein